MALDTAKTLASGSTVNKVIQKYYDKLFLKIAEAKLVHKQLGQHATSIGQGEGGYGTGLIAWTKWSNLTLISSGAGEGVPTTTVALSATQVTATPAQYDNAVSISDILAYTSFGDIMKAAVSRLAYNAGISIDTVVRNIISTAGTNVNPNGAYWSAVASAGSTYSTSTITDVRRAVRFLEAQDAFKQADGNFVAVIHPHVLYDLQGDTTTGGWVDANKYTDANAEKLMSGEVGKLMGVRFLATSNSYTRGSSYDTASAVVASSTLYVTSYFGQDAFGVTDLQNLKTYIKDFGSGGVGDPTDKIATAGWKTTFGAAVLNSAFFVNCHNPVSSTA